jgi:hypothetical protein
MNVIRGSCLCGANAFVYKGNPGPITACHCTQCRRQSGHFSASFDVDEIRLTWERQGKATTYVTPGGGTRGFCPVCGSKLWFRAAQGQLSIEAGLIDGASGARLAEHIFVADKGDYYGITDGLPQSDRWGET